MSEAKRHRILEKIRKLQAKTTAMGYTEAEALAAAQAVGRLLDEYGLTMTDVELQSTECVEDLVISPFITNRHPIRYCLSAIADYCHTEFFFRQSLIDAKQNTIRTVYHFFGLPHDVEIAVYLTQVIMAALERETRSFKRTPGYLELTSVAKREALKSFRYGMSKRISTRLNQMKTTREQDLQARGRELVSVVGAVVSNAFAQAYPRIQTVGYQERPRDAEAYEQGVVAGGRVGLNPSIRSGEPLPQLSS